MIPTGMLTFAQVPEEVCEQPDVNPRDIERAKAALHELSSEYYDDYTRWIDVGMSLRELGNDGFHLWKDWSRQSSKFQAGECEAKWPTCAPRPEGAPRLESLLEWAEQARITRLDDEAAAARISERWGPAYSLTNLPTEATPPDWLIPGVIAKGMLVMPYGLAGDYKSTLAMDLAMAIASGREWLPDFGSDSEGSGFQPQKANVLWLDMEQGQDIMIERLVAMRDIYNPEPHSFTWYLSPDLRLGEERAAEDLSDLIRYHQAQFVVIDPFVATLGGLDENSSAVAKMLLACKRATQISGATIFVIHHSNKSNTAGQQRMRGSTAIPAGVDLALELTRAGTYQGMDRIKVSATKSRRYRVPDFEFATRFETDGKSTTQIRCFRVSTRDERTKRKQQDEPTLEQLFAFIIGCVREKNDSQERVTKTKLMNSLKSHFNVATATATRWVNQAIDGPKSPLINHGSPGAWDLYLRHSAPLAEPHP